MRHAKSSWKRTDLPDFERPLNKRGRKDAPFIGKLLAEHHFHPDLILTSPATRALATSRIVAEKLGTPLHEVRVEHSLYESSPDQILNVIRTLSETCQNVLVVGHNPELTTFINSSSNLEIENLPTSGAVCLDYEIRSWKNMGKVVGNVRFFEYPKKHAD